MFSVLTVEIVTFTTCVCLCFVWLNFRVYINLFVKSAKFYGTM